jgi:hypothetical protein
MHGVTIPSISCIGVSATEARTRCNRPVHREAVPGFHDTVKRKQLPADTHTTYPHTTLAIQKAAAREGMKRVDKRPSVGWSTAWRYWSTHLPDVVSCDGNAWSLTWQYAWRSPMIRSAAPDAYVKCLHKRPGSASSKFIFRRTAIGQSSSTRMGLVGVASTAKNWSAGLASSTPWVQTRWSGNFFDNY